MPDVKKTIHVCLLCSLGFLYSMEIAAAQTGGKTKQPIGVAEVKLAIEQKVNLAPKELIELVVNELETAGLEPLTVARDVVALGKPYPKAFLRGTVQELSCDEADFRGYCVEGSVLVPCYLQCHIRITWELLDTTEYGHDVPTIYQVDTRAASSNVDHRDKALGLTELVAHSLKSLLNRPKFHEFLAKQNADVDSAEYESLPDQTFVDAPDILRNLDLKAQEIQERERKSPAIFSVLSIGGMTLTVFGTTFIIYSFAKFSSLTYPTVYEFEKYRDLNTVGWAFALSGAGIFLSSFLFLRSKKEEAPKPGTAKWRKPNVNFSFSGFDAQLEVTF